MTRKVVKKQEKREHKSKALVTHQETRNRPSRKKSKESSWLVDAECYHCRKRGAKEFCPQFIAEQKSQREGSDTKNGDKPKQQQSTSKSPKNGVAQVSLSECDSDSDGDFTFVAHGVCDGTCTTKNQENEGKKATITQDNVVAKCTIN